MNRAFWCYADGTIHASIEQRKARRLVNGNTCSSRVLDCQLVLKLLELGRDRASRSSVYECSQLDVRFIVTGGLVSPRKYLISSAPVVVVRRAIF